jgi:hypothetical protein
LEKLTNKITFSNDDGRAWRSKYREVVKNPVPKREDGAGVSVVTREKLAKERIRDEERNIFSTLSEKLSSLGAKPSGHLGGDSLLEGEGKGSTFTFLRTEKR